MSSHGNKSEIIMRQANYTRRKRGKDVELLKNVIVNGTLQLLYPHFKYILSLDLSENEIYNLHKVLDALQPMQSLSSLQLQGNPCSVSSCYKTAVVETFPQLIYLDNTKLLKEDKVDLEEVKNYAAVIFMCHRIIGLPPPPKKEKGVKHEFYLEVFMPLLENNVVDVVDSTTELNAEANEEKKEIVKVERKEKKAKSKGKKSKTVYDKPTDADKSLDKSSFKTERFSWSKVIQLPEDALIIESPKTNFIDIRDTFRSRVTVKLIYLKIGLPQKKGKKGKNKKDKKDKKKKGKDKKRKGKGKSKTSSELAKAETVNNPEEPPKENIIKKITMADFTCDLHSINWSDKTIDFFWADHPKMNPNKAIEIEGSLRALKYADEGGKKGKKGKKEKKDKKKKGSKSSKSKSTTISASTSASKESMPKFLTIQVGFGLKRSYVQEFEPRNEQVGDATIINDDFLKF